MTQQGREDRCNTCPSKEACTEMRRAGLMAMIAKMLGHSSRNTIVNIIRPIEGSAQVSVALYAGYRRIGDTVYLGEMAPIGAIACDDNWIAISESIVKGLRSVDGGELLETVRILQGTPILWTDVRKTPGITFVEANPS